jgi:predicted methyltransferase
VAADANARYQTAEGRQAVAAGLGRPERDATQKPQELVDAMGLKPGMTVADIGTGVGYMLPYLSRAVGPSGHVMAEDIFEDFLNAARQHARELKLENVAFLKGSETDPRLADGSVDVILALDSYHHYDYPEKMLAAFMQALRNDGRLVVVEYYKRPNAMPGGDAVKHIRLDEPDLVREIERNGFRKVSEREHIKDSQYMVVFEKK